MHTADICDNAQKATTDWRILCEPVMARGEHRASALEGFLRGASILRDTQRRRRKKKEKKKQYRWGILAHSPTTSELYYFMGIIYFITEGELASGGCAVV